MSDLFKFPLKVEETSWDDINILDADGMVVMKCNWAVDLNHIARQKARAQAIVEALWAVQGPVSVHAIGSGASLTASATELAPKRRGNPNWIKGMKQAAKK